MWVVGVERVPAQRTVGDDICRVLLEHGECEVRKTVAIEVTRVLRFELPALGHETLHIRRGRDEGWIADRRQIAVLRKCGRR